MAASTQKAALGDACIALNHYWRQVEEPGAFAKPDVVANFELPWKCDTHIRFDHDAVSYSGAKEAKGNTLKR